jgi:hypothetical protein
MRGRRKHASKAASAEAMPPTFNDGWIFELTLDVSRSGAI